MIKEVNQKDTGYDFHKSSLSTGKLENFINSNSEFLFVYHLISALGVKKKHSEMRRAQNLGLEALRSLSLITC